MIYNLLYEKLKIKYILSSFKMFIITIPKIFVLKIINPRNINIWEYFHLNSMNLLFNKKVEILNYNRINYFFVKIQSIIIII